MKLWTPSTDYIVQSEMTAFKNFLVEKYGINFTSYADLHQWSVEQLDDFWAGIYSYFKIGGSYTSVHEGDFIGGEWFKGATVSYSEHIFRNYTDVRPALIYKGEVGERRDVSWAELKSTTLAVQTYLKRSGIGAGDCVAGVLNNTPEALAIFLAVNSLGAIWTCCSPDFGADSIRERFEQISPKVLFADKNYHYNGKLYRKSALIRDLAEKISSIEDVVVVQDLKWRSLLALVPKGGELQFEQVSFSHPLWVLYSSGTTGVPKAITHSTGGNLIEHYKVVALHQNVSAGERFLWYSTTGWMMWNYALGSLLCGATLCLYEGSLSYPSLGAIWRFAEEVKLDHFGAGAAFYIACAKRGVQIPSLKLKTLGSTGSPLPADAFVYLQNALPETQIISLSGGTDVCSAFLTGCPWLPVYAGEIQCAALGAAIEAWSDEGKPVVGEVGELVLMRPMPSMPLYFWNDEGNTRFRSSYFEKYPGVWCHGDWIKFTENQGVIIYGRSDATLNRGGVRIGTAEIYNAIDDLVSDSLVVCVDEKDGSSEMRLYIKVEGKLSAKLEKDIKTRLKTRYTPRHVPDKIIQVPDIPYTLSGKKLELPIKRLLMGFTLEQSVSRDAVRNPEALDFWL
jgi:acetoacetyl-CoA synthetase